MITSLKPNQIFVFGSNEAGQHLGGAAKQAHEQFGAIMGFGEGLYNQSYAFPTLNADFSQRKIEQLVQSVDNLFNCCKRNPDKEFLLTKVGCGIAGYPEEDMKELFAVHPKNLILPEDWN